MAQMTELEVGPGGEVVRAYNLGLPSVPYCLDLYWVLGYAIHDGESDGGAQVADFELQLTATLQRLLPDPDLGEIETPLPGLPSLAGEGGVGVPTAGRGLPAYGGSDSTRSSFNNTRYVRGASAQTPIDVTLDPVNGLIYRGMIGAEHGTQTIFLRFRTTRPSRVGLRRLALNPYTDQYLDVFLWGPDGRDIPLAPEASLPSPETIAAATGATRPPIPSTTTHADVGYWSDDYVEDPGGETAQLPIVQGGIVEQTGVDDLSASLGGVRPAGSYGITITSSQWPRIPFQLQILAREVAALSGIADFGLQPGGRFTLRPLAGAAGFEFEVDGRFSRVYNLGEPSSAPYCQDFYWVSGYAERDGDFAGAPQVVSFTLSPVATVQRLSPLQGLLLGPT
jgi:hypothetical protein